MNSRETPAFVIELFEDRVLLSSSPTGMTPAEVRQAYGFDQVAFRTAKGTQPANGAGQTIAIVDAYNDPNIVNDLKVFDQAFGLPNTDSSGKFVLSRAMAPGTPTDSGWALETSLDVEWAHAIAPKAHILLVEAASASTGDLLNAINYARRQPGVVSVSMSWGGSESPFESYYDNYLTTPSGHIGGSGLPGGITFVSSSGDSGAAASWPAVSPNVVAVGGTSLHLDSNHNYQSESAWSGSGGGISVWEPYPTAAPDVAYNADPRTGFSVYDSLPDSGKSGWQTVGGTSAGAPQWAALFALVDQSRALAGLGSLSTQQTLKALYAVPATAFHDITTGSNGYSATPGFDLVTGLGTPVANQLIPDLVAQTTPVTATKQRRHRTRATPQIALAQATPAAFTPSWTSTTSFDHPDSVVLGKARSTSTSLFQTTRPIDL